MAIAFDAEPAPLRRDEQGDIRVGGSRVLLDLVVRAFEDGATPETIVQMYPTLTLVDVYGAVTYYLRHREDVENYLREREQRAAKIRKTIEARQEDVSHIRERLLRRRETAGTGDAAAPE
jgi:uncharacterized protein (DUF433 family)